MKICLEGSVEEIEQFLYGGDEAEEECKCKCENEMTPDETLSPDEKLKLKLINAYADAIDALINSKAKG